MSAHNRLLYKEDSLIPVICERPDWRRCEDHKHLSDKKPRIRKANLDGINHDAPVDDPNDDITSVNEYAAGTGQLEDMVIVGNTPISKKLADDLIHLEEVALLKSDKALNSEKSIDAASVGTGFGVLGATIASSLVLGPWMLAAAVPAAFASAVAVGTRSVDEKNPVHKFATHNNLARLIADYKKEHPESADKIDELIANQDYPRVDRSKPLGRDKRMVDEDKLRKLRGEA